MSKVKNTTISVTKSDAIYRGFLSFYPEQYRKRFGQEMLFSFQDMYKEEVSKYGKAGFIFWFSIITDTMQSAITQHIIMIKKEGVKKYFHITVYNILGAILLLPFIILLGADFLGRLVQGDLIHYNRAWYAVVSHTILYSTFNGHAYLLWATLILAPFLAVVLNLIPVLTSIMQTKKLTVRTLFLTNPLAIVIIGVGVFALLVIYGHDFFPCVVHGLLNGSVNKEHILSLCSKA